MIELCISGGQTGADQAGWRAAKAAGIITGGFMPPDWMTEDGPRPEFMTEFGAEEWPELCLTLAEQYRERTRANAFKADATIWFGDPGTRGGRATRKACLDFGRPFVCIKQTDGPSGMSPSYIAGRIDGAGYRTINVSGNRESSAPGIGEWVERYLSEVFRIIKEGR